MRLLQIHIERFRGIEKLDWTISGNFVCLIGPCDARKTTILDAIELVLSEKWNPSFTDSDFYNYETSQPFVIRAVIGDLPEGILADDQLGHSVVGWKVNESRITEDPEPGDDIALVIELDVGDSLEPSWFAVKGDAKTLLRSKERARLGAIRLGTEVERHLTWSSGSALSRMTDESMKTKPVVLDALRAAKRAADSAGTEEMTAVSKKAQSVAKQLGIEAVSTYRPGLDLRNNSLGNAVLAIHDGDISTLRAGMGTRKLLALAIQRHSVRDGALLLIDEIEHGLEPFRLRHAIRTLKEDCARKGSGAEIAKATAEPESMRSSVGQTLITSHSTTTVVELTAAELAVVRSNAGHVSVRQVPDSLQSVIRRVPEALLARRVIVCEGKTEFGICRALDRHWAVSRNESLALRGIAIVEGGGKESPSTANAILGLGYEVLWFGDSDDHTIDTALATFADSSGCTIRWSGSCKTETVVFRDLPLSAIQQLVTYIQQQNLEEGRAETAVLDQIRSALIPKSGVEPIATLEISDWLDLGYGESEIRNALAKASCGNASWFKRIDRGQHLGKVIASFLATTSDKELAKSILAIESWSYGD